jgi:hypothetical protein
MSTRQDQKPLSNRAEEVTITLPGKNTITPRYTGIEGA